MTASNEKEKNSGKEKLQLDKIVTIHYKDNFGKPPWAGGGKDKGPSCYDFISKGAKWKELPQEILINPSGSGLSSSFVSNAIALSGEEWDGNTNAELFNNYEIDLSADFDFNVRDGTNELVFGNYPEANVIAVAYTWGYFNGKPSTRKIVEFDIMFDTDFPWGDGAADNSLMDLQNIATHEIGHGLGLADVYESDCNTVTMYGYSWEGDIDKRTLETADITGIQELYGAP
jgi:hypothetical protein